MAKYAPISKEEIESCIQQGMTREKMIEFFGVNRYFMQKELARHGINLKNVRRNGPKKVNRKKSELYDPFPEDDLPDDFDPDTVPLDQIDPSQLTILEQAILKLGDRVSEKSTGYFMDRVPVSVDTIIKEAGLS
jgi:hypothetical protein